MSILPCLLGQCPQKQASEFNSIDTLINVDAIFGIVPKARRDLLVDLNLYFSKITPKDPSGPLRTMPARASTRLRRLLRRLEEKYYVKKLESLNSDLKKNWKVINKMLNRSRKSISKTFVVGNVDTNDKLVIANSFSQYFRDNPLLIHNSIPDTDTDFTQLIDRNNTNMLFSPCTMEEVSKILANHKKEGGITDISRRFMILCKAQLTRILVPFFNSCIGQGIFPDIFKTSKITPVHKKGPSNIISNHRPISILCNMSKIFESIIYMRLQNFFMTESLLSEKQFGFRSGKSTELAVFDLLFKVLSAIEQKNYAICVFFAVLTQYIEIYC